MLGDFMKIIQVILKKIILENERKINPRSSKYKVTLFLLDLYHWKKLFNHHDTYIKKRRMEKGSTTSEYEGVNIRCGKNPRMINVGKCWTQEEKEEAKKLFLEYQVMFAWSYEDFKKFHEQKFQTSNPLETCRRSISIEIKEL